MSDSPIDWVRQASDGERIAKARAERDTLAKALRIAANWVEKHAGSCPCDMYDWQHPLTCDEYCDSINNDASGCWVTYFTQQAEKIKG